MYLPIAHGKQIIGTSVFLSSNFHDSFFTEFRKSTFLIESKSKSHVRGFQVNF